MRKELKKEIRLLAFSIWIFVGLAVGDSLTLTLILFGLLSSAGNRAPIEYQIDIQPKSKIYRLQGYPATAQILNVVYRDREAGLSHVNGIYLKLHAGYNVYNWYIVKRSISR